MLEVAHWQSFRFRGWHKRLGLECLKGNGLNLQVLGECASEGGGALQFT